MLIKCGLHKDSRATALTQLPECTMGGRTAGRRGGQRKASGLKEQSGRKRRKEGKVRDSLMQPEICLYIGKGRGKDSTRRNNLREIHPCVTQVSPLQRLALDSTRTSENMQPSELLNFPGAAQCNTTPCMCIHFHFLCCLNKSPSN